MPTIEPCFYNYFFQYQAVVVRYHMRKDLREAWDLHQQFTTNSSESINAALKCKVNYKESDLPQSSMGVNISTPQPTISRSDVHPPPVSSGPPLLIHTPQANVNPFYLKPLSGNIRVCMSRMQRKSLAS